MPADPVTAASPFTLTVAAPDLDVADYDGLHAAVMATAQGRWFLAQYASRNRNADTAQVLAAIGQLKTEALAPRRERLSDKPAAEPPSPPDIARVRHGLGEFAAALMHARTDIAAIDPPGAMAERPTILATTEALAEIAWHLRERGIEPELCDRLDGCATDIRAVCAIPDLTAQRTRAIVDALGDLESRVQAIRASLDDGSSRDGGRDHDAPDHESRDHDARDRDVRDRDVRSDGIHDSESFARDPFDDLRPFPAANANTPPAPIRVAAEKEEEDSADIAVFASPAPLEPTAAGDLTGHDASAGTVAVSAVAPPWAEAEPDEPLDDWQVDRQVDANSAGMPASPRLSHLLIAAELDRLRDAQAAPRIVPGAEPGPELETATVEAAPVEAAENVEPAAPIEEAEPVEATPAAGAPVEVAVPVEGAVRQEASAPAPEQAAAPLSPQPSETSNRRTAEMPEAGIPKVDIAVELFADVMALSEEERIALFT
jgi:hypothetical protein